MTLPEIRFALPLGSENRWSDMLAVLIATDPQPLGRVLGLSESLTEVSVCREVTVDAANQLDIVVRRDEKTLAVIEVKVLADLGARQLQRYAEAVPDADAHVVVFPERLVVDTSVDPRWRGITWESLLHAYYASSAQDWVAVCARAWAAHLDRALPKVGADTVWNDLTDGEDFVIAMRARMSWLHRQIVPPTPIEHDIVESVAGPSWVVRMYTDARTPGYQIMVEVEEYLPVHEFPKYAGENSRQPIGPSIRVCLLRLPTGIFYAGGVKANVLFFDKKPARPEATGSCRRWRPTADPPFPRATPGRTAEGTYRIGTRRLARSRRSR